MRAIKVLSNVASRVALHREVRAVNGRANGLGGPDRSKPVAEEAGAVARPVWRLSGYWRSAGRRARDRLLRGGWSGGYGGADRRCRQECENQAFHLIVSNADPGTIEIVL
jgi:hypothetical protein